MFIKKSKYLCEKLIAKNRIEYLENIICPTESHKWKEIGFEVVDGYGTVINTYKCENCGKIKKEL